MIQHPRSRAWFDRHPAIERERWLIGIGMTAETASGVVHLAVEADPLEALKLGTYVGSCLGLGGSFAYSAVAVILDVNKRVVYARNCRGSVVARQLLAISTDCRLVCFAVYPERAERELKPLFQQYDRAFATALGLPLHVVATDGEYTIEHILSQDWWDDGVWNATADATRAPIE